MRSPQRAGPSAQNKALPYPLSESPYSPYISVREESHLFPGGQECKPLVEPVFQPVLFGHNLDILVTRDCTADVLLSIFSCVNFTSSIFYCLLLRSAFRYKMQKFHASFFIVNDIKNFVFGPAKAPVYGFGRNRKQKFVMSFTIAL